MSSVADAWDVGPSADDLGAIDVEWPVIEAELDVLDQQIRALLTGRPRVDEVAVRRSRRQVRRVLHRPVGGEAA